MHQLMQKLGNPHFEKKSKLDKRLEFSSGLVISLAFVKLSVTVHGICEAC
jgi:hypothetical protein